MLDRIPITVQLLVGGVIVIPAALTALAWALVCVFIFAGSIAGLR